MFKKETRQFPELAIKLEERAEGGEGIVEGYIAVWNTVDDYVSEFQKGAFKKTIEERGTRIKLLFNHNEEKVIGKVLDIREDDKGVFVRAKISTAVEHARDTYELIKDGVIDTFSFGFRAVKQSFRAGVRVITEVKLYEVSPVVFEANENAIITDVRKEQEERSVVFDESLGLLELYSERANLIDAVHSTMNDIFYDYMFDELDAESAVQLTNDALTGFAARYSDFTEKLVTRFSASERAGFGNTLTLAMREEFGKQPAESIATDTSLTVAEVKALRSGKTIAATEKLSDLPEKVSEAYKAIKNEAVNSLCSELRNGDFNEAETERMIGILSTSLEEGADSLVESLRNFTHNLQTQNKEH